MSNNEVELINIIRNSPDPDKAVMTAIEIFTAFLAQLSASPEPPAASQQGSV